VNPIGRFSGSRKPTRSGQISCNTSKSTSSLIPFAMTPVLRTWSVASALTSLVAHESYVGMVTLGPEGIPTPKVELRN
jgi:hypothetical protein